MLLLQLGVAREQGAAADVACEALLASNAELRQRLAATDAEGMATKAQVERLLEWQRDAIERYNALLARLKASQAAHDELVDSAAGDARECALLSAVWLSCRLRPYLCGCLWSLTPGERATLLARISKVSQRCQAAEQKLTETRRTQLTVSEEVQACSA